MRSQDLISSVFIIARFGKGTIGGIIHGNEIKTINT